MAFQDYNFRNPLTQTFDISIFSWRFPAPISASWKECTHMVTQLLNGTPSYSLMPCSSAWTKRIWSTKKCCRKQTNFSLGQKILSQAKKSWPVLLHDKKCCSHLKNIHFFLRKVIYSKFSGATIKFQILVLSMPPINQRLIAD